MRHAGGKSWIDVRISEGRNQQIRRMFEAVGARVEKLRRDAIGPLELGKLDVGDARRLSASEVSALKSATTPGTLQACVVSTERMRPCATGDQ